MIKIPRWTFEKFPDADETLTTQMKSVGEAMAIGRTFKEALQKGIRSMEVKRFGFGLDAADWMAESNHEGTKPRRQARRVADPVEKLRRKLAVPSQGRLYYIRYALKMGWTVEQIHELTNIDPWFLAQMKELTDFEGVLRNGLREKDEVFSFEPSDVLEHAKQLGYSDVQMANAWGISTSRVGVAKPGVGA